MKTPYYLINKEELDRGLETLKSALNCFWPNYSIGYSYKTNSLPWIIQYYNNHGCYAEVVSDDEYNLAKSIGANNIIYNGIAKSKETFLDAINNHAIVNIDSEYEIEWLDELHNTFDRRLKVGVRVNFDLESMCKGQTQCGEEGERFGFCYENGELLKAINRITDKGVEVIGLHLHKSSKTRMPDIYRAIAEIAVTISRQYNLSLEYIDIGGGFFGGLETKPQFCEYFEIIGNILKEQFDPLKTTLIVEPGMALIGSPIDYCSTVIDIKRTTRNCFVITDGSRTQIDPLMTKSSYYYEIRKKKNTDKEIVKKQVVSGFTCMEHDRIFELRDTEKLEPGDQIIYHKVGAYTMSLSPLFIKWFPDVYVRECGKIFKVRSRWSEKQFKSRSFEG